MHSSVAPDATADLSFRDRALRLEDALVLADLHLGKAAASRLELPIGEGAAVVERLERLLADVEPTTVVLAGDVLHSFGTVPATVESALAGLGEAASEAGAEIVALEGNHDAMLETAWDGKIRESYRIGETVVCHGHEVPDESADRYVFGHDHPTIALEGRRRPCYLAGDDGYEGSAVVVLPAFSQTPRGVRVNEMTARDFQSPLVADADTLSPIVWDDDAREALAFPPLGEFRHRL